MFSDDQILSFRRCPRCEERAYECFKTHSYCANCNYSRIAPSELCAIPRWVNEALNDKGATVVPLSIKKRRLALAGTR